MGKTRFVAFAALILFSVECVTWLRAEGSDASITDLLEVQSKVQRALPRAMRATVVIGSGASGVIVSSEGLVLSAEHVTNRPGRKVTLTMHDGRRIQAETLGASRFADAGMLRITDSGEWSFAPMAEGDGAKVGDWCFGLGHPAGYDEERGPVVRVGKVISKRRNVIRTDCQLIGGDSGGPLLNLAGEVIGIHSHISEELDDNYHAPVEAFRRHWTLMLAGEVIPPQRGRGGGSLGVRALTVDGGVLIDTVFPGSAAASASLKTGWIITQVDGLAIGSRQEFGMTIGSKRPGDEVTLRYIDDQEEGQVTVQLGDRPRRVRRR